MLDRRTRKRLDQIADDVTRRVQAMEAKGGYTAPTLALRYIAGYPGNVVCSVGLERPRGRSPKSRYAPTFNVVFHSLPEVTEAAKLLSKSTGVRCRVFLPDGAVGPVGPDPAVGPEPGDVHLNGD